MRRLIYIVFVFFIFSCGDNADQTQISDSQNICKYSKWLRISESKDVVRIEIINPDNPDEIRRLSIPNFKFKNGSNQECDITKPVDLSLIHI